MTIARSCLYPTDFGPLCRAAAPLAEAYALALGCHMHVVHAQLVPGTAPMTVPVPATSAALATVDLPDDAQRLREFCDAHFPRLAATITRAALLGAPSSVIPEYAERNGIGLIIIPTHADGILRRIIHGSVSKSVLESSPCPVLMIPAVVVEEAADTKA